MTGEQVMQEMENKYAEHIEMMEEPYYFLTGILCMQIANLRGYIEYLERRLENVNTRP